jgi:hypothetical protein
MASVILTPSQLYVASADLLLTDSLQLSLFLPSQKLSESNFLTVSDLSAFQPSLPLIDTANISNSLNIEISRSFLSNLIPFSPGLISSASYSESHQLEMTQNYSLSSELAISGTFESILYAESSSVSETEWLNPTFQLSTSAALLDSNSFHSDDFAASSLNDTDKLWFSVLLIPSSSFVSEVLIESVAVNLTAAFDVTSLIVISSILIPSELTISDNVRFTDDIPNSDIIPASFTVPLSDNFSGTSLRATVEVSATNAIEISTNFIITDAIGYSNDLPSSVTIILSDVFEVTALKLTETVLATAIVTISNDFKETDSISNSDGILDSVSLRQSNEIGRSRPLEGTLFADSQDLIVSRVTVLTQLFDETKDIKQSVNLFNSFDFIPSFLIQSGVIPISTGLKDSAEFSLSKTFIATDSLVSPAATGKGDSGGETVVSGALWITIVGGVAGLLVLGGIVWGLIIWKRRRDKPIEGDQPEVTEIEPTITECDITAELECENPLVSDSVIEDVSFGSLSDDVSEGR